MSDKSSSSRTTKTINYKKKSIIEDYIESLDCLPSEIVKSMSLMKKIDECVDEKINNLKYIIENTPEQLSEIEINRMFDDCQYLTDEKIGISKKCVNIFSNHIDDARYAMENFAYLSKRKNRDSTRRGKIPKKSGSKKVKTGKKRIRESSSSLPMVTIPSVKAIGTKGRGMGTKGRGMGTKGRGISNPTRTARRRVVKRGKGVGKGKRVGGKAKIKGEGKKKAEIFCFCNRGSEGEMIGCDNPKCERKWFHFKCVGIQRKIGENETWYCDECKKNIFNDQDDNYEDY